MQVNAEYFTEIFSAGDLRHLGRLPHQKRILGGGSNLLMTADISGLVIRNMLKGRFIVKEDEEHVWLQVMSGENWHELVMYTVALGLGGFENLALIPGTVGASPMQNIGAYGVEAKDLIESVNFWHWELGQRITFNKADCRFGYRDSIFKRELKDQVFITSVVYRLSKRPVLNTTYGAIDQELAAMGVAEPSVADVAQAVINIRTSKLPDPAKIGNAGSFFKNPTIPNEQYHALLTTFPAMPHYKVSDTLVKVPAGWLIEQCGFKGYRSGDCGVHDRQALVLVNYGNATGSEIWTLSTEIVNSVQNRYGITLEREVQVWE